MATNVKPTPAGSFPLGHATENKDASAYTGFKYPAGGGNDIGVYKQPMSVQSTVVTSRTTADEMNMSVGNISRRAAPAEKTDGIKIRGAGAAIKGTKARGPMA